MKELVKKYSEVSLVLRIACGLALGVILALVVPGFGVVSILGTVFVGALKAVAPILVFVLIIGALANAASNIGGRFKTVIILYMLSTFLAAVVAVTASFLFPVMLKLNVEAAEATPPQGIGEVLSNLIKNMVQNPVKCLADANYVGILFWAVIFGLAVKAVASAPTRKVFNELADVVSKSVRWIINLAPFGICGLVFDAVRENGLSIFTTYGKLLVVLVGSMLAVALIVDPLIAFIYLKRNPYPLVLKCLKESGITAFFTRSSAANIPVNMNLCENLGLDRDFYSVSIPLGATINMDGAAITITIMTLAAAATLGVSVDVPSAILLSMLATLGACGASGVAGGSLLLIPMACSLFGINNDIAMQVVQVGFIIGVIQDSVETALNSAGDVMFAATAEYHDRAKRGEEMGWLGKFAKK